VKRWKSHPLPSSQLLELADGYYSDHDSSAASATHRRDSQQSRSALTRHIPSAVFI